MEIIAVIIIILVAIIFICSCIEIFYYIDEDFFISLKFMKKYVIIEKNREFRPYIKEYFLFIPLKFVSKSLNNKWLKTLQEAETCIKEYIKDLEHAKIRIHEYIDRVEKKDVK